MNRHTPIAAALLTLFAGPLPVFAQSLPTPPAPTASSVPEIVIKGSKNDFAPGKISLSKLAGDVRDIAQSVTVVNKALMQSQGANSLADALRNVSGITLGGAEGGQIGNNFNLNGFTARTDIYLDGFRNRGQFYRDTFALDSVEVLMGPSSMLFGRGSTGGVINQVSKKPMQKEQTEIGGSVTSNGLVRATIDSNTPLSETSAVRILGMAQEGNATSREQNTLQDFGFAPSLTLGIGTPTEITLSALLQHNRDMPDYGLGPLNGSPVNVSRNTAFGYKNDHTTSDVVSLTGNVLHKLTSEITISNQTQYDYVKTSAVETAPNAIGTVTGSGFTALASSSAVTPASSLPLSSLYERLQSHDRDIGDYSIFNVTELKAKLSDGRFQHDLLAGFELGHDGYDNQAFYRNGSCNGHALNAAGATTGYVDCVSLLNPDTADSPASAPSAAGNRASGSANTVATYVNDTMELNSEFKLAGGLRYDRYTASISNSINSLNTSGSTVLANGNQTVGFTSVRLGAIWQPGKTQSYYVSYGTSFNPSLEQLVGTLGQQNIAPEKNRSYELGGKWDLMDGNVSLNSALFQIQKDNARSLVSAGVYELDGTVRVNGLRAGASGRVNKQLQLALSYTYLDARIVNASALDLTLGKTPANTPKNTLTAWATYEVAPHWELGGGPAYMAERYANNTDLVRVAAYTRWDATVAYKQAKYDIRLNFFNLGNKKYYDGLVSSDGGRAVPGTERTAALSLNYRF